MSWGLIARSDMGGLGTQTHDIWRELRPDKTLLTWVMDPRGIDRPDRYDGPDVEYACAPAEVLPNEAERFCEGLDAVLTVETFYGGSFNRIDVRRILVANPELYGGNEHADRILVPTPWQIRRMPPGTMHLPHPTSIPPDGLRRIRTEVKTFLHVAAPAMLDRNGTDALMAALPYVDEPCRLIVRSPGRRHASVEPRFKVGKVEVSWRDEFNYTTWDGYPTEADCLVLPRRYGGLCLPAQEAASCWMPLLMTDLSPQQHGWPAWLVPTTPGRRLTPMKGGMFDVYDVNPWDLASEMTALVRGQRDVEFMSRMASVWAASRSWPALKGAWRQELEEAV